LNHIVKTVTIPFDVTNGKGLHGVDSNSLQMEIVAIIRKIEYNI